ncbi:hypothetical protein U0070_000227 [Myodes glareolus]|uniref:Uncharacterized protein n=1 Tax=Myodes glareolus TaxID=447135 RepID=A0AAW0HBB3_MYOGA
MCLLRHMDPTTKKTATSAKDNEDNDIDLFGSNKEEEDKKAAQLQEESLQQFTEKEAKKPSLVVKSFIS